MPAPRYSPCSAPHPDPGRPGDHGPLEPRGTGRRANWRGWEGGGEASRETGEEKWVLTERLALHLLHCSNSASSCLLSDTYLCPKSLISLANINALYLNLINNPNQATISCNRPLYRPICVTSHHLHKTLAPGPRALSSASITPPSADRFV